jgi:hypothetical protein
VLATMSSAGVNTPEEQAERQHITFHAVQTTSSTPTVWRPGPRESTRSSSWRSGLD